MEENKSKLSKSMCRDAKFAVCATDGNMLQVKLGELAQTNASSASVKKFAQTVVGDHSKSMAELKALAVDKKISLPEKLSDKSQKTYDWFLKKQGEDFDKAYMKCTTRDHKKELCEYEKAAKKAEDADIKKWASSKVPELKSHLDMAKATCKEIKK
jgi:putative membrane protein